MPPAMPTRPVIGITCDLASHPKSGRLVCQCASAYAECVERGGGVPVLLPPHPASARDQLSLCAGLVLTGGDDPRLEAFGVATDPRASPMNPRRQEQELALLALLEEHPRTPVLGICLGMQLMGLHAGGTMDQHLPQTLASAGDHWDADHAIVPTPGVRAPVALAEGRAHSKHRQALVDPGRLLVAARSSDGVVECVVDPGRRFYLGVQWHPERTGDPRLGQGLFDALVGACRP